MRSKISVIFVAIGLMVSDVIWSQTNTTQFLQVPTVSHAYSAPSHNRYKSSVMDPFAKGTPAGSISSGWKSVNAAHESATNFRTYNSGSQVYFGYNPLNFNHTIGSGAGYAVQALSFRNGSISSGKGLCAAAGSGMEMIGVQSIDNYTLAMNQMIQMSMMHNQLQEGQYGRGASTLGFSINGPNWESLSGKEKVRVMMLAITNENTAYMMDDILYESERNSRYKGEQRYGFITPGDYGESNQSPVGEPFVMLIMAAAYAVYTYKKNQSMKANNQ